MTELDKKPAAADQQQSKELVDILRSRVGKKKSGILDRRHARHECSCIGVMSIVNRSTFFEGIISQISKGGLRFRPAKHYLLEHKNTQVLFEFGNLSVAGKIVATRPDGYGVALFDEIDEEKLEAFLAEYGGQSITHAVKSAA